MGKNKVQMSDERAKNIKDFQSLVFNFLDERKINYADGISMIGAVLMAAFQYACIKLEMSAEKTKKAFDAMLDAMLDEMKTQQNRHSNDFFEEGDNETTYAN